MMAQSFLPGKEKELLIWRKICLRIKRLRNIRDQVRQLSRSPGSRLTCRDGLKNA
jgi:hypothetical protein